MKSSESGWTSLALLLCGLVVAGCDRESVDAEHVVPAGAPQDTQNALVTAADSADRAALEPGMLRTVATTRVVGFTGPGGDSFEVAVRTHLAEGRHARRFGTKTLITALRTEEAGMGRYPCTSCHLGRQMVLADKRIADVHQDIVPVHPAATGAVCSTCHAAGNVEQLALRSGERASLDHTYRLCAQCHFRQAEAWAAGAHGKRLDGWQGRRVVMGCADCHDPHAPAVQSRIPFRAPVLHRPRGPAK